MNMRKDIKKNTIALTALRAIVFFLMDESAMIDVAENMVLLGSSSVNNK
jgi:hypothetical protein